MVVYMAQRMIDLAQVSALQQDWRRAAGAGGAPAEASAAEAFRRCGDAVGVLSENLRRLGYPCPPMPVPPVLDEQVRAVEAILAAPLPPIIALFWRNLGGLSFVDLEEYRHREFWDEHGLRGSYEFCDGVHVDACEAGWIEALSLDFSDWKDDVDEDERQEDPFLLCLSPDGYHKDNISGDEPYGVYPGVSWLAAWENFSWTGAAQPRTAPPAAPDFLSYLRTAILECAGFPGLLGSAGFADLRDRLLEGVPLF